MSNAKGEWCLAYHGVGDNQDSEQVKKITGLIAKDTLIKGSQSETWKMSR